MQDDTFLLISQITALCVLFFYTIQLFAYLRLILKKSSKNNLYLYVFAAFNTIAAFNYQIFLSTHLLLFYVIMLLVFVESLILSPRNYRQALFGASVVVLHIATVYLPIVIFLADIFGVSPLEVITVENYRYLAMTIIFAILNLILLFVKRFIKNESFILVSSAKTYSEVFIFVIFFMCTYLAVDCTLLITPNVYSGQFTLSLITSIFTIVAFYSILIYTIDIVTFAKHKRQSDLAQLDYDHVLIMKKEIVRKNTIDDLTELYNRKFIYKTLNEFCTLANQTFALLYIDVNGLKFVNDNFGHEEGDKFLKNVGIAIRKGIREDDYPARIGGDEFIVLLYNILEEDVVHVVKRIETNLSQFDESEKYPVSASIGYLYVTKDMCRQGYKSLLEAVDNIMRENKAKFYTDKKEKIAESHVERGIA